MSYSKGYVGNFCETPGMLTEDGSDYTLQSEYYYIGHLSCFLDWMDRELPLSVTQDGQDGYFPAGSYDRDTALSSILQN